MLSPAQYWWTVPVLAIVVPIGWTWAFVLATHARWLLYMRHTGRPLPTRSWGRWLVVWQREVRNLLWTQMLHLSAPWSRRPTPGDASAGPPVLCVHGFTQNGTNFQRIRRALARRGRGSAAFTMGYPPRAMDRYADKLEARIDAMLRNSSGTIDIVAHSMGGIILRRALQRRPDLASQIGRIVTLGSPHFGTGSARGVPLPETRAMGRRGAWLPTLPTLAELAPQATITTVGSIDDTTVYPEETTRLPDSHHITLTELGHGGILVDPEAVAVTIEALHS